MALLRIHYSMINEITERLDEKGIPIPFSFEYFSKSSGLITVIPSAVITSSFFSLRTRNIKNLANNDVRTYRNILFKSINGIRVYV